VTVPPLSASSISLSLDATTRSVARMHSGALSGSWRSNSRGHLLPAVKEAETVSPIEESDIVELHQAVLNHAKAASLEITSVAG
jgi:hypothetical protein